LRNVNSLLKKHIVLCYKSATEVLTLQGEKQDAAVERDGDRLVDIVDHINRMLYEKEQQLKAEREQNPSAA
jgi:hypothetical protein